MPRTAIDIASNHRTDDAPDIGLVLGDCADMRLRVSIVLTSLEGQPDLPELLVIQFSQEPAEEDPQVPGRKGRDWLVAHARGDSPACHCVPARDEMTTGRQEVRHRPRLPLQLSGPIT